jgi:hypothetical protein
LAKVRENPQSQTFSKRAPSALKMAPGAVAAAQSSPWAASGKLAKVRNIPQSSQIAAGSGARPARILAAPQRGPAPSGAPQPLKLEKKPRGAKKIFWEKKTGLMAPKLKNSSF